VPTLVVSGACDGVCQPELQAELAAAIAGAEHVTIQAASHMTPLDRPVEVASALRRWLAAGTTRVAS
jgi:pimeloyl-ACP methyl ester carboxylesterase